MPEHLINNFLKKSATPDYKLDEFDLLKTVGTGGMEEKKEKYLEQT